MFTEHIRRTRHNYSNSEQLHCYSPSETYWPRVLCRIHASSEMGRRGLSLFITGYPIAVASDFVTQTWLLVVGFLIWVVIWAFHYSLGAYRNAATANNFASGIEDVNSSFAGCIEDIAYVLSGGGTLTEEQCKQKCVALLHRIKDALDVITETAPGVTVRATLAVPSFKDDRSLEHLRVWCYDETYANRRWSILEPDWPGAPKAFQTNKVQAVEDLPNSDMVMGSSNTDIVERQFRSVVSVPVARSRSTGKPIAVVNLDATEPDYFDIESFIQQVIPVVLPIVHMIGLAILAKDSSDSYSFG